jgi:tRNA (mo5U34)-methyltransferase
MNATSPIKCCAGHESGRKNISDEEALALINSVRWYHSFELRPGITTPGQSDFNAKQVCDSFGIAEDLSGKKVLDIGAWDGPLTFEMERRGAQAVALDIQDPKKVGFDVARTVLGSKATHYQGSIYQLPFEDVREFDLIVMRGVYYHLKYPLLGFECAAAALKLGGILCFEGEGLISYAEDLDGNPCDIQRELSKINELRIPVCLSYPNSYKKANNWFIPNLAAIKSWIGACGMKLDGIKTWQDGKTGQRLIGRAIKVSDHTSLLEHPLY